jgi:hypothetical protein
MTYTTVMVGLSIDQPNEARLEIAGQLAERFGERDELDQRISVSDHRPSVIT